MLSRFEDFLPDLSGITTLLPDPRNAARLRGLLLAQAQKKGHRSLLMPRVSTLRTWVMANARPRQPVLGEHGRELMMVEALAGHLNLFGQANPWTLADDILHLFDELTLNQRTLPDTVDAFEARLVQAYGVQAQPPAPLSREARLIHTLWTAWHAQLEDEGREDTHALYLRTLEQGHAAPGEDGFIYLAGIDHVRPAERTAIARWLHGGRAEFIVHGPMPEGLMSWADTLGSEGDTRAGPGQQVSGEDLQLDLGLWAPQGQTSAEGTGVEPVPSVRTPDALGHFLEQCYDWQASPIQVRARRFARAQAHSPAAGRLRVFEALDAEEHANGIDVQIRLWLADGAERIGIVTEDRRLARRVRALLERAGLLLQDGAGWALSTTSAAAALERWLQCVEEDFACQPLMDVLKSPFVFTTQDREALLATVYRLERDIILRENIARGLERYAKLTRYRAERLPDWAKETAADILELLARLEAAADPLRRLLHQTDLAPATLLDAVEQGMERLGMSAAFAEDPAGLRILQGLRDMRADLPERDIRMDWPGFRAWLGRVLETRYFRPNTQHSPVQLLSLEQSRLSRFDAAIVAAVDTTHLPGDPAASAFFNEGVRRELGLMDWQARLEQRFRQFRALLESAPRVLLSYQIEREGEPVLPCPWVEALRSFHRLAYGDGLEDESLAALARHPGARIANTGGGPRPALAERPAPPAPAALLPKSLTASRHQALIDCPYRFFAAECLSLEAPEEITEALQKADYGERVHLCLEAFHGGHERLPGPFYPPLTPANRTAAIELLQAISEAVFARDLEDNFLHRGWRARWLRLVPAYIDWQIEHAQHWQVLDIERRVKATPGTGFEVKGRIDRVDQGAHGLDLIDYKTGGVPKQDDVASGEAVQLISYALLAESVHRVEYLQLGRDDKVRTAACLEGEDLARLKDQTASRLGEIHAQLHRGAAMPAWGDPATCTWCEMSGLCRRAAWDGPGNTDPRADDGP